MNRGKEVDTFFAFLISIFLLFFSRTSFAQDFMANTLGDYGNVTVMEVTGNYDADNSDGSVNSTPREAIANEFFRIHKDEYDFLVIFSNFDFKMPASEVSAFYLHIKNDVQGIGSPLVDNSALFGSNGKLQGTIDMGNVLTYAVDPTDPNFENPLYLLSHEVMHRWAAYVNFKDSSGNISTALLGVGAAHWSFLLNSYGSVLYGNQWQDNGDGTFTSIATEKYYSPLDLYLMGLNDKSQVPPMLLINNPAIDPTSMPDLGATITGTAGYVSIDDIIAAEGERIPNSANAQKTFKTAFIFITTPGTFTGNELQGMENIRSSWITRFSVLTNGQGIMQVTPTATENLPVNAGPVLPTVTPRTLPPNINDAVTWLMANQKSDGSWMDLSQTANRDTAEAVLALKNFPVAQQNYSLGFQWLNSANSVNTDYLSRKIETLANSGQDLSALINLLVSGQNGDGGWGSNSTYMSNPTDTSFALGALSAAGYSNQTVISPAIVYLQAKQNADGGWGGDDGGSTIEATANVLNAFGGYRSAYQLETQITNGVAWLTQRQNPDGGFGNSPSTVYDSALAVLTLTAFNAATNITNNGLNYILSQQSGSGSWNESPYQTALAINAVWKATVAPDLSVKADDITFTPPSVSVLPSNIVMNVTMWNLGMTAVPQAKVALYNGSVSAANMIGEQSVAFPGQSSVTITFPLTITDGSEHTYYVVIDPDNLIQESNKANNTAVQVFSPQGTYDFQILPSNISASPNPANIFQDVTITSTVSNLGTLDAYNVQVQYYLDNPQGALNIATSTVNIPAGGSVTNQVTWNASMAGNNLPLTVLVDPSNAFTEVSKTNNKAAIPLTVLGSTEPNLTVSYNDIVITPNPANQGGNAGISVIVRNQGFSAASNIMVNFYEGTPGVDGVLLGSQTIPSLNAGDSSTVSVNWTNIPDSGEKIIYVLLDPNNLIQEISQNNKSAFVTLNILSLPDLAISTNSITFSPAAPKVGDMVAIAVNVQNLGAQSASNVTVTASEGATVIGSQVIPTVAGNSQASTSFTYDTTGKPGAHLITIVIDPDNAITEQSKANNTASATFGVQNSNMWLTETYISPNGDGVQDSTQFFFSFDTPETVKIVVNGTNGTVRTLTGANLANTTSGNITWDGMDDSGMVVADGQYQIRVIDANNNDLGGLTVVVDNNRSPISDAAGTKYLLNTNLSCMLPDIANWQWFPDESGIFFSLQNNILDPNENTIEYPNGLYTMSPDGEDILRIVPSEWTQGADPKYDYYFDGYDMSPDGTKVAFILDKRDKTLPTWSYNLVLNQMWIVDRDGTNLTLLDSRDLTQAPYTEITYLKWSSTGAYITYMGGNPPGLWIVKPDGSGNTLIDSDGDFMDTSSLSWSPDGTRIAHMDIYDDQGNFAPKIEVSDISGNRQDIFSMTDYGRYLEWLDNATIIASTSNNLWLIDASGAGNNQALSNNFQGVISVAPDGKSFVFTTSAGGTTALNVSDSMGNTKVLYDLKVNSPYCSAQLNNVVWSPDSSRIAFLESVQWIPEGPICPEVSGPSLIVTDKAAKNTTSLAVAQSSLTLNQWLSDGISIVGMYYDDNGSHIAAMNSTTGEIVSLFSGSNITTPDQSNFVSPFEHYITYYNSVDPSSACYGKAYSDLWAISSLLNLTASLRTETQESAIILKGIAADLNFQQYLLEYADVNSPNSWNPIGVPSNVPVLNDVFTTWVPPYEGVFHVRLTVSDKAGNVATDMQRVPWGLSSSISNLYTNYNIFSPNGDGVKDTVELHYTVLAPTHLEFDIYDQNSNLVTTILRDYTVPVNDSITWDGRDSSGNIVPDGTYDIRVFKFDFFVEVDDTPPVVGISFSALTQDSDPLTGMIVMAVYIDGHAFDKNLQSWLVEYGEGDNPQNWYELAEGSDVLIGKDGQGNPVLNPPLDVTIREYTEAGIEFLVGKKLRITATDSAGNVSAAVTGYLEEKVILDKYDNVTIPLSSPDAIYPDLAVPGQHTLGGLETVRAALSSANVQYWSADRQWLDATPVTNPPPGVVSLVWDNTVFGPGTAVRIKAVDILGVEYDSNAIQIAQMFTIDTCNLIADNALFEDTQLLKFEVQSNQDPRYAQWTDYKVFDASKGDSVPEGTFGMPMPVPNLLSGDSYSFRMIGVGVSGTSYLSNVGSYPSCQSSGQQGGGGSIPFSLPAPTYQEKGCGQISDGQATLSAQGIPLGSNASVRSLSYFIQNAGGLQLLKQIDLTTEPADGVTVNTLTMAEGSYPVKAVYDYVDLTDNKPVELSAGSTLIVDRTLPTASITYPGNSLTLCPTTVTNSAGSWPEMQIEGIATDNMNVKYYQIYYGVGASPTVWVPAETRINGIDVPLIGNGPMQGQFGMWDLTGVSGQALSVMLKVVDVASNVSCATTSFSVQAPPDIASLTTDPSLFSPNGDGFFDIVNVNYAIYEYATVDVKVFAVTENPDDSYSLGPTPVRTIVSGRAFLGGTGSTAWDGKDDTGATVPDGLYGIAVYMTDSCGNTAMKWTRVEVDDTPPTAAIASPKPGDQLGNIVQVTGTADDLHFASYLLEAGAGAYPSAWTAISSGKSPVDDAVLGEWNTFGLSGQWTLRLTATDTVANTSVVSVTLNLGPRQNLINALSATPQLFSPNNDGILDTTTINYGLTASCQIEIDMLDSTGSVRRTYTTTAPAAGAYAFVWDGKDNSGLMVPDGAYTVKLHATLTANPSVTEDELISVVVDTTPPTVNLTQPLNNSYFQGDVAVNGTISDANLQGYSINYTGSAGTVLLNQGNQSRVNYLFGTISGLAEGNYTLNVVASDLAGNTTRNTIAFTIDRTPPSVTINTPRDGDVYGSNNGTIIITGSIVETNLALFSLRYGPGDNPAQWTELLGGNTIPATGQLASWNVGNNAGVPDGLYTLSLYAQDKAGLTGEARVKIMVDNNPPVVAITQPQDGSYIRGPSNVIGTATDGNFAQYTVELSSGQCAGAYKWAAIKSSTIPVTNGTLASLQALPSDGNYCLRLTATDKAGNKSVVLSGFIIDTHPPAAPVLSGSIQNKSNAMLTWTQNTEPDIAGYNLYRNAQRINTALINNTTYADQNLQEGVYTYTVTALDFAGNESTPSNQVMLKVDLTPPNANISVPKDGSRVGGVVNITGTAYSADDFKQYRVSIGQGSSPATWTLIRTSPVPIPYGLLSQWDTTTLPEVLYSIKLEAEDLSGNVNTQQVTVTIDNTPPATPVLLSAVANGSDVTLTWQANTEPDLAGYLLCRNDQLANVNGIVVGNLSPYLITGTTYLDKALPDGKFTYYLIAVDQAGNQSGQSNSLQVSLDTHPPHATITAPADGTKFQNKLTVNATTPDLDIATVQFQYKKAQDTVWLNLGGAVTQLPYMTYLDPVALGLVYGNYNLRAVATDQGGKTDPAPGFITVIYTNLAPPAAPTNLKAQTNGAAVTLTWTPNTEADLNGYNVYRATGGGTMSAINTSLVNTASYQDTGLQDGTYTYQVTAVDTFGNESSPSGTVSAKIYAPVIGQPYTPTGQKTLQISGGNAAASSSAEIFIDAGSGPVSQGKAPADANGNFVLNASLTLGENRLTSQVTDGGGNISRTSDIVVVVYDVPPAAPTGFASSVNGYDVNLTWNPNTESNLSGYNLFRNGAKLNAPSAVTAGTITASTSFSPPSNAFDSDPTTSWGAYDNNPANPSWWEIDLPSAQLISHMEIHWGSDTGAQGNETLYAGKDYEVQVWSGYAWITQEQVTGNTVKDNTFDFVPSYRTDRIRIFITDTTDPTSSQEVMISEVNLLQDNLITATSYTDSGLHDGTYSYNLTAVDYYGFESQPSGEAKTPVGDVTPPAAPQNLTATASGSNVNLSWTPNTESDLAGYNVYRNTPQGWIMINSSLITGAAYTDMNLPNGTYTYRVTAVDAAGNESMPSNEASVSIAIALLPPPTNLKVTSVPDGGALSISWEYPGGAAGYNLYRSSTTGGPYAKVNSSLLSSNSYLDTGLTNGTAYYYVVTAVDAAGNESAYSSEATGIPSDTVPPAAPVIFFPTIAGSPVMNYSGKTNVLGTAEPAATVELFENGASAGRTAALGNDAFQSFSMVNASNDLSVSPDEKSLAYSYNGSIWLEDLTTANITSIVPQGYGPLWSPAGSMLTYMMSDNTGNNHIYVYNVQAGSSEALTGDTTFSENSPSWSADGNNIVFLSNRGGSYDAWVKDMVSGSLTQLTSGLNPSYPRLSSDDNQLAYFINQALYVLDIGSNTTTLVDNDTDGWSSDWSPVGNVLTFISYRSSPGDIYTFDATTRNQIQITGLATADLSLPIWAADSSEIVFDKWDEAMQRDTLETVPAIENGQNRIVKAGLQLSYLARTALGGIAFTDQNTVNIAHLTGLFAFSDLGLYPGENLFHATATDSSGNVSQPSGDITVVFDTGQLPDLAITPDDIVIYPPYPIVGQTAMIIATVRNIGQADATSVAVDVYLQDPQGNLKLLQSATIPSISAGSNASVNLALDTTGDAGINEIIVVVDPQDQINEVTKTNNTAEKELFVAQQEGVVMTTTLDAGQYQSSQNVNIVIDLKNSGNESDGTVETRVEDQSGQIVAPIDTRAIQLPYAAEQNYTLLWNTGSTYAGSYRVHTIFTDAAANIIAENLVAFTILPDTNIVVSLVTDKTAYGSNENVSMAINIKNNGQNYILPELDVTVQVLDALNNMLFNDPETIVNLLPGAADNINSTWNTALSPAGSYSAVVEVYYNSQLISSKSTAFTVNASSILTGSVSVSPTAILAGSSAQVGYVVQNIGNAVMNGVALNLLIIDPDTQTIMNTQADTADLGINATKSGGFTLSTLGYARKTYTVALQYVYQANTKTIATASFTVRDGTPPTGTIAINNNSAYTNSTSVTLSLNASDSSGNPAAMMCLSNTTSCTTWENYAGTSAWTLSSGDGLKTVYVWYQDKLGNSDTGPYSASITLDTSAPVLTLSTLPDGSWTNNAVVNVAGTATDNMGIQQVTINGTAVTVTPDGSFSYPVLLQDGPNTVVTIATDLAGNQASDTRTINLDQTAPVITIATPVDNMITNQTAIDLTGSVDEQSTVTVSVNGAAPVAAVMNGTDFSLSVTPVYGMNTIEVTATDLAGNTSTAKRTLTFDDQNPSLSITNPPQDVQTNQANMTIQGEVADITVVTVTVTMDGNTYTPVVTGGTFEQPVTFTAEKTYQINITAVNEVGNETAVQRNVVYDITAPAVTLDPVTSPTNQNSQVLTGTMEAGATVSVACPTATVGSVTYPTATTWTVLLSNMQEGSDSVTVTATDEAGNTSMPLSAAITVDLTPPAVSVSSPAPGGSYGTSVGIGAVVTDAVSGVGSVEYQIDSGGWTPLPLTDPATGTYAITWNPTITDQGAHTVSFRATDNAGNISQPIVISITIQINNTPPVTTISVGAPSFVAANGTYVTGSSVFTLSATDDLSGVATTEYAIDGGPWILYAPFTLPTEGTHTIRYRSTDIAGNIEADQTLSVIVDNTPPTGSITINNGAGYTGTSAVNLSISATDGTGSGTATMCVSNTSSCTAWENYAGTKAWTLSSGDGGKTVYVWYQDNLGNTDLTPYSASITLDSTPPVLTVSTLADGSWTNNPILNVAGQVTDNAGMQQVTVSGTVVTTNADGTFSYPATLQEGPNIIIVTATDLAGNQASDTRTVNLDQNVPVITITSPADNMKTKQSPLAVTGNVAGSDGDPSTVAVIVNASDAVPAVMNGNNFSLTVTPVYGINTIEVTATDLAGNTSTVKRTVTFDNQNPSLSVTDPNQDIQTNQSTVVITGQVADITAVTVTVTMDGNVYTPAVTSGQFQQSVTFTEEKTYQIMVTAVDEVGNQTTVQRNIVYDITPPTVTIDPVTSPTNQSSQTVTGTMETGAAVNVTCATASVGAVTYPTQATWSVTLTNMTVGNNQITVSASDAAGNVSKSITTMIVVDTTPPVTMITGEPNNPTNNTSASFSFTSSKTGSTFQCQLDSGSFAACTSPVSYTGLADGTHTFSVKATDAAGNTDPTPPSYTWTIDTKPPITTITGEPNNPTNNSSASFSFTSNKAGSTFQCQLDSGSFAACTSPVSYTGLADGTHAFSVKATDAAGNTDPTPPSYTWTIDTTPPTTTITGEPNNPTNSASASFSFTSSKAGSTFQCQLDGGSFAACTSPVNYSGLADGTHVFVVKAVDTAGITDPTPPSYTWVVDTTPPTSAITSPISGATVMAATITISGTASDKGTLVQKVEVSMDGGSTWNSATGTTSWSYGWNVPADGTYTIKSRATDGAGNVEVPGAGITVTVYRRQPTNVTTSGRQLLVSGNPFIMKGVIYSPVPIGDDAEAAAPYGDYFTFNYNIIYSRDLPLLREMGANTVRLWTWDGTADHHDFLDSAYNGGENPIYVIAGYWINPGLDIDPQSPTNVRQQLTDNFTAMVAAHKNHPAIVMWAIGNDLNGSWMYGGNLENLFSLINEMAAAAHAEEGSNYHPVTAVLMDSNLISTISAYDAAVPSLDVWGANVYRGNTFGTLFNDFTAASSKPLAILEYGIDAFDNVHGDEYENIGTPYQGTYGEALWNEIKANSGVCIGGSIREYSDEWWKGKYSSTGTGCPDNNPALHSACGYAMSSSPDGYDNEEWWGIMRTAASASGPDTMQTRVLYYVLQELWAPSANTPHIAVSPPTANFGSLAVGGTPPVQAFTIANAGTENLDISTITISGTNASEFILQKDYCSGHTLVPSKTCTFQVMYSPVTAGSKSATLSIPSDDPSTPTVSVALSGTATVSISGTVTCGGSPLAGVTMTLSGGASATAMTDASGNYTFAGLGNGTYTITPGKTGYTFAPASSLLNINGSNITGQNFTATAVYSISGTVTSGGSALSGVTMTLSGAVSATATTDASGNYTFAGLVSGSYTVTPSKTGYTFTPASKSVTISSANITGQNFTTTAVYSISGTVTAGGSALSGVTMTLSGGASATTTTDTSGNYTFAGLVNGSYTVTPSKTGYTFTPASKSVTISSANVTGQNFATTAVYSISGTVTSGGSALSRVTMTLSGTASATTTTDTSGNYSFTGLVNGSYTVTPSKTGYTFTPTSKSVTISSANVAGENFTATAVYSISGTVTAGGSALSGVTMTLSGTASATTTTDASGNYSFTGLVNGSYTVTPSKTGYTFTPTSKSVTISSANVTAQNFAATAVYSISGTVTSGGSALSGVTMALSGAATATSTTDGSGNYTFTGLASGSYTVTPSKAGYTFTPTNSAVTISSANITGKNFTGALITFTITPSASGGGSISPSTPQTVNYNGTVSFTVTANAGYHIAGVSVDGVSQGPISSYTFTNVVANHTISASFTRNFGVFGATGVMVSAGYVDSYDSSKGSYSGAHGPNGSIGTNSIANGAINLSGGALIYGDALVGPGGNPTKAITTSGGAVIYGSEGALSSAKSMTPMTDPGGGTSTSFTNGSTLTSGTYRVSSINLSGSGVGTINGNVTLYVTGNMTVSGSAQIVVSQGSSLTVYVSGSISVSGGGIVNKNLNAHNLTIYGTSTCTTASYSGSSAFYGVIYTPKASTSISGGGGIYGSIIGGSITISGGAAVHYDESLGNIGG